jgi:hypothetical protein
MMTVQSSESVSIVDISPSLPLSEHNGIISEFKQAPSGKQITKIRGTLLSIYVTRM